MIRSLNRFINLAARQQKLNPLAQGANKYFQSQFNIAAKSLNSTAFNFQFSSAKDPKTSFDSMWSQAFNKIKDVDSNEIFSQFKEEIAELNSYEMVLNYCLFILDVMKQRVEVEKAIEVCNIAIEFSEKKHNNLKEPLLVMFKGQKALFFNRLGKKQEAINMASDAQQTYDLIKETLSSDDKIGAIKLIQEVYQTVENYQYAEKSAKEYQELIMKDENRKNDPFLVFQAHSALFDSCYGQGKIKEALEYGLVATEQISKLQQKTLPMHYLLIGVSFSYYQLGDSKQSDLYLDIGMEILKQLPPSKEFSNIEKKKEEYLTIREKISQQYQAAQQSAATKQQSEQLKQSKEAKQYSDSIWNEEDDHGQDLRGMRDYKEAIEFYEQKLKQLNPLIDAEKIVNIHDRMALVYYEMKDIPKAIELSKKAHEQLLKLRNQKLVGDKLSFQNLSNLKIFNYQSQNYQQAVDWGKKWHSVCEQIKAFDTYSYVIEEYMIQHVLALKELGKFQESLDYSKKLENFVMKFNKEDPSYQYSIKKLQYELHYFNQDLKQSLQCAADAFELIKQIKTEQAEQLKAEAYSLLRNITALGLQVKDEQKIIKYGVEFLNQQPSYEKENQYTRERQLVEMNIGRISSINGDFEMAEKYLMRSLETSKKLKVEKLELSALISLASILVRQTKVEQAFSTITEAQEISKKLFPNQQDNEINLSIARILSFIYHLQKDYKNCLEQVDRCLAIQRNIPGLSNELLQPTIDLLRQLKSEVEDQESVLVVANKHNLFKNE